ncbi:MAG: hypothetical protein GY868_07685, partial [Deltaproteobacteria bacterium]|nr:hypothetical protein [Deltaproteobacteria bacterium]
MHQQPGAPLPHRMTKGGDKQRKRRRATATLLFLVPFTLTCACLAIGAVRYYEIAEAPHVNTDS